MSVYTRSVLATLALVLGSMTVVPSATACGDIGEVDFDAYDCYTSTNICTETGGNWICNTDPDDDGDDYDVEAYLIYDPSHTVCADYDYCAWGTDTNGYEFCCEADPDEWTGATLLGGDGDDWLYLQYDEDVTEYNLRGYPSEPPVIFDGMVQGLVGEDHIYGSRFESYNYNDLLQGGTGVDNIYGEEGGDHIEGGDFGDYIWGGPGEDWISGGDGPDHIWGEDGVDHISGDAQADVIYGGDGNDVIHGGTNNDVICGEGHDDVIYGDDGDDKLCGYEELDVAFPGPSVGNDGCNANTEYSCDYALTDAQCAELCE